VLNISFSNPDWGFTSSAVFPSRIFKHNLIFKSVYPTYNSYSITPVLKDQTYIWWMEVSPWIKYWFWQRRYKNAR
jgi:hypothetical protein